MGALQHIKNYLHAHFAGHDVEGLMQHFETSIEAKVEEAVAEVKADFEALRDELTGGRPAPAPSEPMPVAEPTAEPEPEPAPAADATEVGAA